MARIEPCKISVSYIIAEDNKRLSLHELPESIQNLINDSTLDIYNWLQYAMCRKHDNSDKEIVAVYENGKICFRVITCCSSNAIFCQTLLKEIDYPIDILSRELPFRSL